MKKSLIILSFLFLIVSCGNSNVSSLTNNDNSSFTSEETNSSEATNNDSFNLKEPTFVNRKISSKDEVTADDLFSLYNHVDVKVYISDTELNKLQSDYKTGYKSDIYRVADKVIISLTNYGTTYSWEFDYVGIRQKGNTSRRDIINNGEINTQNHYKLSFDETFDNQEMYDQDFIDEMKTKIGDNDYSEREFLGLNGLDFKWNRNNDETRIKEIYASYLYQANGIISQRIGLSNFTMINNSKEYSFGLCNIYEPAKKRLIKQAFQNNENYLNAPSWKQEKKGTFGVENQNYGDLYKCTYGVGDGLYGKGSDMSESSCSNKRVGVRNISGSYIPCYERKTNTDVTYNDDQLKNIFKIINNGTYEQISKVVDMDYFAKLSAVNYIIGNPDDYRYNYNNYMIYIRRVDGKMIMIPLDNDRCFGITDGMNFENGLTNGGIYSKNTFAGEQRNKLILKTVLSSNDNETKTNYVKMIEKLIESSWVKEDTFDKYENIAKATYEEHDFGYSSSNLSFSKYISSKVKTIKSDLNLDTDDEDETVYDNLYVVGNFNSWGNYSEDKLSLYKFKYEGNYTYTVSIYISSSLDNNQLQFKINAGYQNYSDIDWTFNEDLTKLEKKKGGNAKMSSVYKGDTIKITFNTKDCSAEVKKI